MAITKQIILYKYARDQKYSCNTLKVKKRNQLSKFAKFGDRLEKNLVIMTENHDVSTGS